MTAGEWPSAACWDLFAWLHAWNVPPLVPAHLRNTLENAGHESFVLTRGCPYSPDLAYSHMMLSDTHEADRDFFLARARENQAGCYWGFGLKSGDIVVFIQTVSSTFSERFTPDVRAFKLFMELLWGLVNEPSRLHRPIASVTFSTFRDRRARMWTRGPDETPQPVGAGASNLDVKDHVATRVDAVLRFTLAVNASYDS